MKSPLSDDFYFRLEPELKKQLFETASITGKSISELIRNAVEEMLDYFYNEDI